MYYQQVSGFANTLFEFGTQTRTNDPIVGGYIDDVHSLYYFGGSTWCDLHGVQWGLVKTSPLKANYCVIQARFELGLVYCSVCT